jgi:hypothetical protein
MIDPGRKCVIFRAEQLLPHAWRHFSREGPVRTFNPGLLRESQGWILAYRIVATDGLRRIGICRLNQDLEIVGDSQVAWSDHVRFRPDGVYPEVATHWFADPRLYRFSGRLFIYWNSGWHEPRNCQFVQEIDPVTLRPIDYPRELLLREGGRQQLEKNWTFFAGEEGKCFAVYSIQPHRILTFSLEDAAEVYFDEVARIDWSLAGYPSSHGGLRGGAPPVLAEGQYWNFCHSVHDGAEGYRYAPALYSFAAAPPFAPTSCPIRPLELDNPFGGKRTYERLNRAVGEVIYPCGAARDGARWLISHGINDEYSAISTLEHADVLATLVPRRNAS